MLRPPEDWQSQWLELQKVRLGISSILGWLDRWIKRRIRSASEEELLGAEVELWQSTKEGGERKSPARGKRLQDWSSHPLNKLLFDERVRREIEREGLDYLGPLSSLSESELRDYLIWKGDKHGSVSDWRKDKKRTLPVIPTKLVGDGKETQTNNRGLPEGGEGIPSRGLNSSSHPKGRKTSSEEVRAYGPRKKG